MIWVGPVQRVGPDRKVAVFPGERVWILFRRGGQVMLKLANGHLFGWTDAKNVGWEDR